MSKLIGLKWAREANDLTQEQLAGLLDPPVGARAVYQWEAGLRFPGRYLTQLAEKLDTTVDYLLQAPPETHHPELATQPSRHADPQPAGCVEEVA